MNQDDSEKNIRELQAAYSDLLPADLRLMVKWLPSDCVIGNRLDVRRLLELGYEVTLDWISDPPEPGRSKSTDGSSQEFS